MLSHGGELILAHETQSRDGAINLGPYQSGQHLAIGPAGVHELISELLDLLLALTRGL